MEKLDFRLPLHALDKIPVTDSGHCMSNFDGEVDKGMAKALKANPSGTVGYHYAWEFCSAVWYQEDQFHALVKRYRQPQEVISAETLEELMVETNNKYGWD